MALASPEANFGNNSRNLSGEGWCLCVLDGAEQQVSQQGTL